MAVDIFRKKKIQEIFALLFRKIVFYNFSLLTKCVEDVSQLARGWLVTRQVDCVVVTGPEKMT